MARRKQGREVVYVERGGDASAKWLFWGAVLGAGLALLYAPRTGEETRRVLQRKLWKLRAMTEEKLDELAQQFGSGKEALEDLTDDDDEDFDESARRRRARARPARGAGGSAREELERRLAESRARGAAPPATSRSRSPEAASGPAGGTGRPPASSAAPCRPPTKTTSRSWPARSPSTRCSRRCRSSCSC